jgi:5-(carboxyamino)imidazole ribonucleotide mutase
MAPPRILVLLGSDSDLPAMERGLEFFRRHGIGFHLDISSAHRNPEKTVEYAKSAREKGFEVIIAMAGMAAHLPGVIAAHTTLPVIGVPAGGGPLRGVDALLSIVQMPPGVPVAAVGIDGARNAAILACQILSLKDGGIAKVLDRLKVELREENEAKARLLANKNTD